MTGTAVCISLMLFTSGAVIQRTETLGPVMAKVVVDPSEPVIGDAVTMTLTVVAEKDVELLMPEFGEALDRFTILDFVPRRDVDDQGRTTATQRYRLQPPMSGQQSIPPILIEFVDRRPGKKQTPEGQDAYELLTPRIDFTVKSVVPKNATAELKPPLGQLQPLGSTARRTWPWVAGGLCVAAMIPLAVIYLRRARRRARRRSAYDIARGRLDRLIARPLPQADQIDAFFVELSGIVRRYLEDRFELRAPELTTEEFLETVTDAPDLSKDHQALLRDFLRRADLVKFAGMQPSESDIRNSIAAAERFLTETAENSPLLEQPDETSLSHDESVPQEVSRV